MTATQASMVVALVAASFLSVQITAPLWLLAAMWVALAGPALAVRRAPLPARAAQLVS